MTFSDLLAEKNSVLLELERAKRERANRATIAVTASKAAVLEADIATLLLRQGSPEKAAINLISQASCYLDARRTTEAARVFNIARSLTQIADIRSWIDSELQKLGQVRNVGQSFTALPVDITENTHLRRPQRECYLAAALHFASSTEHAIIQLPVGCGKTGAMSILPFGLARGRVLVVAPNLEIRRTLASNFDYANTDCFWKRRKVLLNGAAPTSAVLDADANILDCDNSDLVVTNIQQLVASNSEKWLNLVPRDYFDMILIDEAHHNVAPSWQKVIDRFANAKVASFTATPLRSDGQRVEGKRIYRFPIIDAIKEGFIKDVASRRLTPSEIYFEYKQQKRRHSLEEVLALREEEWFNKGVALSPECNRNIVDASIQCMRELRDGGKQSHQIIGVACSIDHAKAIRSLYAERQCRAEVLHSKLRQPEQERILTALKRLELDVIVQVQMLNEGADYPHLSVAAIFRPYRHLVPYVQFVGRIMRVQVPDNPGHPDNRGFVVTHVGLNVDRWWDDLKQLDNDDQDFFEAVAEGQQEFLLVETTPTSEDRRRKFTPEMTVLQETIEFFVQQRLLPEDKEALLADLINALAIRGVSLESLGLSKDELEKRFFEGKGVDKVGKHQVAPVQPQAARQEARTRLDERVRSGAKQLLAELGMPISGFNLPKMFPKWGATNNLAAAAILLNQEVQAFLEVGSGDRSQLSEEELRKAHDNMDTLIDRVAAVVRANKKSKKKD